MAGFAGVIAIPTRHHDRDITISRRHGLARKPARGRDARRHVDIILFALGGFGNRIEAILNNDMACGARRNATARVIDVDAVRQRNFKNRPGLAVAIVGNFCRVHGNTYIRRQNC